MRAVLHSLPGSTRRLQTHLVLVFVGAKMLIVDLYKVPIGLALGIVAAILAVSVVASLAVTRKQSSGAPGP